MDFEADRLNDATGQPSLAELTGKALSLLGDTGRFPNGYLLLVEGGRIDHAHHAGNWHHALEETLAFDLAVEVALARTSDADTLIAVTADHGFTGTFAGAATQGNDILGLSIWNDAAGVSKGEPEVADDGKTYTTLGYAQGPGGGLRDINVIDDPTIPEYVQEAIVSLDIGSHGGQDVAIWARGPRSHLIGGTFEQNSIFFALDEALQLRSGQRGPMGTTTSPFRTTLSQRTTTERPNQTLTETATTTSTLTMPPYFDDSLLQNRLGFWGGMFVGLALGGGLAYWAWDYTSTQQTRSASRQTTAMGSRPSTASRASNNAVEMAFSAQRS